LAKTILSFRFCYEFVQNRVHDQFILRLQFESVSSRSLCVRAQKGSVGEPLFLAGGVGEGIDLHTQQDWVGLPWWLVKGAAQSPTKAWLNKTLGRAWALTIRISFALMRSATGVPLELRGNRIAQRICQLF
jgi:hypothetical protein